MSSYRSEYGTLIFIPRGNSDDPWTFVTGLSSGDTAMREFPGALCLPNVLNVLALEGWYVVTHSRLVPPPEATGQPTDVIIMARTRPDGE